MRYGAAFLVLLACACAGPRRNRPVEPLPPPAWESLFDGASLAGWAVTPFGGEGDVRVEDGHILFDIGQPLTGIHWTGDAPPREDYEIVVVVTRVAGSDFFCGLTFPVGDEHCSLILGGWGGSVCGLSNVDGLDASSNPTTQYRGFVSGLAYTVRVRVGADAIEAWLDDEPIVHQVRAGHAFGLRPEVLPSRPLGIASFNTAARIEEIRLRRP